MCVTLSVFTTLRLKPVSILMQILLASEIKLIVIAIMKIITTSLTALCTLMGVGSAASGYLSGFSTYSAVHG